MEEETLEELLTVNVILGTLPLIETKVVVNK